MTKGRDRKQIHWYPGHMASATRELKKVWKHISLKLYSWYSSLIS
jgi:ribosome biogenesis GTPase A